MPLPTDYHAACRDAVKTVFAAALATDYAALSANTRAVEDVEEALKALVDLPAVLVACVGPEQDRPEFSTNVQDGKGFPILVALLTVGVPDGQQAPLVPGMTAFRAALTGTFNKQRLSGVAQVGYCEVSDSGEIFNRDKPAFQALRTAMVVNCVGRFPRG